MKHTLIRLLPALLAPLAMAVGCSGGFSRVGANAQLVVTRTAGDPGRPDQRLPLSFTQSFTFTTKIEAKKPDGTLDTGFNGFVRASIKPGTIVSVTGPNTDGRNVLMKNGVADGVNVEVIASYGDARIWFEDVGYTPADPIRNPPPQCADGKDNNGNGLVDFPADPGCAFANDDSEDSGSFATGATDVLYFTQPRIADVRGVSVGGNGTVFPHDQVQMDTGWRGGSKFAWNTLVTRVSADGFYASDLQDDVADVTKRAGYGGIFAFTYSTPPLMRVCDRLKVFGGTASDFFGFTEVGFPTWLIEEWDFSQRECGVPSAHVITLAEYADAGSLFKLESSLVRINAEGPVSIRVTKKFGPGFPKKEDGFLPHEDATNCDFNHDGKIQFTGGDEQTCSVQCDGGTLPGGAAVPADPECSEYSAFAAHNDFKFVVTDSSQTPPVALKFQANGSSSAKFDPRALKGKDIRSFTGTFRYFSGGSQWTMEARCEDDIVVDLNTAPFCSDADYDAKLPCPTRDGQPSPLPVPIANRLLACVHARGISDINESSH